MRLLSKSSYLRGHQCPKSLWLQSHKSSVLTPLSESDQVKIDIGNQVGEKAYELFPNGKKIPYIDTSLEQRLKLTREYIEQGVENIYEATFLGAGVIIMVDILHKVNNESYEIYEVKGSSLSSKSKPKQKYIDDIAIQKYVLGLEEINIKDCYLITLNSEYVHSEESTTKDLLRVVNLTKEIESNQTFLLEEIDSLKQTLQLKDEPDIDIGYHCNNPDQCDAKNYCWKEQKNIPDYSVFNIFKLTKKSKALDFYQSGILKVEDIPVTDKLTQSQIDAIELHKFVQKNTYKLDALKIKEFISEIKFPIYYFDFETFQQAIPKFIGVSPYQQIPFQYSVHIQQQPGLECSHREYLSESNEDPREKLLIRLIEDLGQEGTILAFNASFEMTVIKNLMEQYPKYQESLNKLMDRFLDLATPFKNKDYYHKDMGGGYSIKKVLPILVPEMNDAYSNLDLVHNGGEAMNAFAKLDNMTDKEEIKSLRESLLRYCELDTLAMVKILEKLRGLVD